ncbi:hypothetical protein [Methylobacterium sp. Leaf118]|uniref:hypothetical protein n=1 Tax=Methylobacterium sp. Leaf118 TaxID=2876562 RepID=UPI001E598644|nr:hypothetical protein [Methylobacterium sp. Leaf118]
MATITIGDPSMTIDGNTCRAAWSIDNEDLWFETDDIRLTPNLEAAICAVMPCAANLKHQVACRQPVDEDFAFNINKVARQMSEWWGSSPDVFESPLVTKTAQDTRPPGGGTALFFSGGVDSFYSLLRSPTPPDVLVYVHGFDIPLNATERMIDFERTFRDVASAVNARSIIVRSNYRTHHLTRKANWGKCHGGALASVAHCMSGHLASVQISSSYPYVHDRPWGSHWKIDYYWSTRDLRFSHFGAHLWRAEKLKLVIGEPLVRQHLTVCWEHRTTDRNCGQCEKCLRTMLLLAAEAKLGEFETFPNIESLKSTIDDLPKVKEEYLVVFESYLSAPLEPGLLEAIGNLVGRSRTDTRVTVPSLGGPTSYLSSDF